MISIAPRRDGTTLLYSTMRPNAPPRRAVLASACALMTVMQPLAPFPTQLRVSAAVTSSDLALGPAISGIGETIERRLRPVPKKLPRRRMDLDFAVLLMRTSYQVADDLDFTPMNDFQRDFFLLRQDEWDVYREMMPSTKQGDLSDPSYFDFISFCQYATISNSMRSGRTLFNELIDANGTAVVISRNPAIADNKELPALQLQRVGDSILNALADKYPSLAPPVPRNPTAALVQEGVSKIAFIFEINDYFLTSRVKLLSDGLELTVVAPATQWSQQVLSRRGDLSNAFEAMVVQAFLRRCSIPATYVTKTSPTEIVHRWSWPAGLLP